MYARSRSVRQTCISACASLLVLFCASNALALDVRLALRTQRAVQLDTPLNRTQWLGAHNAWNESGAIWANQRWTAEQLLDSGIRAFDLDLHRNSSGLVALCHDGCSSIYAAEDNYENELVKYAKFLANNPREILFVDIEDKVNDEAGVIGPLLRQFGDKLYRPSDKPAGRWETPNEMIERGRRVIVKSANATYHGNVIWDGRIFSVNASAGYNYREVKYFNTNDCTTDSWALDQSQFYGVMDSKIGQPFVASSTGNIDAGNIAALMRCGLDFVDADRWDNAMLMSAVWTWADGEPNNAGDEDCAEMRGDGRWNDVNCGAAKTYACQRDSEPEVWSVTSARGRGEDGARACAVEFPGSHYSVPQNALQNARLLAAGGGGAWLNFSDRVNEGSFQLPAYSPLHDGVAYQFQPSHEPGKCMDVSGSSTVAGGRLEQHDCHGGENQKFWAVDRGNDTFALVAAGSGMCLDQNPGTNDLYQYPCHYGDNQLWRPEHTGSGFYRLVNRQSGKVLEASGVEPRANGTPLQTWAYDGSGDMRWQFTPASGFVTLEAYRGSGQYLSASGPGAEIWLRADTREESSFRVVPGLADTRCVSFESKVRPGKFLRHSAYQLWADTNDGRPLFAADATFCVTAALVGDAEYRSFESQNYPGHFIRHSGGRLRIDAASDEPDFRAGASFRYQPR